MTTRRMIRTFVFFDLETTDIIQQKRLPKITELAMVAVSRQALCDSEYTLPRTMHKLVLPVNPKTRIAKGAEKVSQLSNEILTRDASPLDDNIYKLINNFINLLEKPICLLAHNGNRFDYPVLLGELKSINQCLNNDLLTIDTLPLFRAYYKYREEASKCHKLLNDDCDELLSRAMDDIDKELMQCDNSQPKNLEQAVQESIMQPRDMPSTSELNYAKQMQKANEKTPESQIIKSKYRNTRCLNDQARKILNFDEEKPKSFSLQNIYSHMFQSLPDNAHYAEGDCIALLRCVAQISSFALNWSDEHAVLLTKHAIQ